MFKSQLVLVADADPDFWFLDEPLQWVGPDAMLIAPTGFRTDLASIPEWLRNIPCLDPNGRSRRPAVMHDWLYTWQGLTKAAADRYLYNALIVEGVSNAVAQMFYFAVHEFGQPNWDTSLQGCQVTDFDTPEHYFAWKTASA